MIPITDAEQRVLSALWGQPPMTLGEIAERVADCEWSIKTIKTLLGRLVDKNAVHADKSQARHHYSALIRKEDVARSRIQDIVKGIFDDRPDEMLAFFCRSQQITSDQVRELVSLLERGGAEE